MSHNTFGHLFRVTTFGESHGPAIGCVIDGCPPGLEIAVEEFRTDLDRRATGKSRLTVTGEFNGMKVQNFLRNVTADGGQINTNVNNQN